MMIAFIISCNSSESKTEIIATINYELSGCFASEKNKIIIYKVDTSIMANLENDSGKLLVKARLNKPQLDTFNLFISGLRQLKQNNLSTTVCRYSVVLKNESIKRIDVSCEWDGFNNLSKCLFKNGYYLFAYNNY